MRPYYDADGVTIYHGDCRAIIPTLDLNRVNLGLADPPYGETSLDWDVPSTEWLPLVEQVGYLWCFGSLRMFMAQAAAFGRWKLSQDTIWEKHNGSNFAADRFKRVHEQVALFYRGRWDGHYHKALRQAGWADPRSPKNVPKRYTSSPHTGEIGVGSRAAYVDDGTRMVRSVIHARSEHHRAIHPTQKPEAVVAPLVEYACPPGGLVLDPFMGSGTTLRVAKDRGMRAIGIELDEATCEKAARRLDQGVLVL
jgi:site-specific DNA-methyltransferase (adenine-specific)